MSDVTVRGGLTVATELFDLVNNEILIDTGISPDQFWSAFDTAAHKLAPKNHALLQTRAALQAQIDDWLKQNAANGLDAAAYEGFLRDIGYLVDDAGDFTIDTANVDPEIATIAGPQLVVPITNARYALNAANARWGSLYDALYGTDAIADDGGAEKTSGGYNPVRGAKVIAFARKLLDESAPLAGASWTDISGLAVENGALQVTTSAGQTGLADASQFVGYTGDATSPTSVILVRHGLHFEILINANGTIGAIDTAHIDDIMVESALTSIIDLEDSIAAVDAEDKVLAFRNWNKIMRGTLTADFVKNGAKMTRRLNDDKTYIAADGSTGTLRGRALMLVRNVGHLMTNPAVLLSDGSEIPEGILDAFVSVAAALPDMKSRQNSPAGSIYVVKPKLHGPDEVAFTSEIFDMVEQAFNLPANTVKLGIMDEERRTTVNLKECIRAAKSRVAFINTGFLDRTGDEIHTSMHAGPMIRKGDMKAATWIAAYEDWNVDIGLACGFSGKAQIGKGMWAMPDLMAEMLTAKVGHPEAGANCAWVPSPTAATLHVSHYHRVSVAEVQKTLAGKARRTLAEL
ncbi:MAG: malate synthase G, partial [Alphaproteobacteria bacterium]|nr:malate synthase G [Alphaproteobacteria bacterium]